MRHDHSREGMTGLEMIIIIAILLIFMYAAASAIFGAYGTTEKKEGGIIVDAVGDESEILVLDGDSEGIQDTGGVIMGINLACQNPHPSMMGSCLIPVRLLTGSTGSIDMSTAKVVFSSGDVRETLPFTTDTTLNKPGWTIADRNHLIPLAEPDEDIYLEPNEVFTLLLYPENPVSAEESFSITLSTDNAVPLNEGFRLPPLIRTHRIVVLIPG